MTNKRGVTLLTLAVVIVILTILVSAVSISGAGIIERAQKTKLQSEIDQLEVLTNNYITRNSGIKFNTTELDISSYTAREKEQFAGEEIENNSITLYIVDLTAIDAKEVNYGLLQDGQDDRYLYSATTKKIYYEKGIVIGDINYHRIDKMEED